jgi:hypothetical protein
MPPFRSVIEPGGATAGVTTVQAPNGRASPPAASRVVAPVWPDLVDSGTLTLVVDGTGVEALTDVATVPFVIDETGAEALTDAATLPLVIAGAGDEQIADAASDAFTIIPSGSFVVVDPPPDTAFVDGEEDFGQTGPPVRTVRRRRQVFRGSPLTDGLPEAPPDIRARGTVTVAITAQGAVSLLDGGETTVMLRLAGRARKISTSPREELDLLLVLA